MHRCSCFWKLVLDFVWNPNEKQNGQFHITEAAVFVLCAVKYEGINRLKGIYACNFFHSIVYYTVVGSMRGTLEVDVCRIRQTQKALKALKAFLGLYFHNLFIFYLLTHLVRQFGQYTCVRPDVVGQSEQRKGALKGQYV